MNRITAMITFMEIAELSKSKAKIESIKMKTQLYCFMSKHEREVKSKRTEKYMQN